MIHGDWGHIRAFALSWPICGKHALFLCFVCDLSDDPAAGPNAVCRMVAVPGGCRTLSHLYFQRKAKRLRCSRPGMGNGKRSPEIHHEVSLEAGASSFGVYCHSCRLHQERRCSVNLLQYHVLSRSTAITKRLVDMSDVEIGELLNVVRTTGFRHRKSALAKIKQYLEGKADDEHR